MHSTLVNAGSIIHSLAKPQLEWENGLYPGQSQAKLKVAATEGPDQSAALHFRQGQPELLAGQRNSKSCINQALRNAKQDG